MCFFLDSGCLCDTLVEAGRTARCLLRGREWTNARFLKNGEMRRKGETMHQITYWLRLIIGYLVAILRGLLRDRTVDSLWMLGSLLFLAYVLGNDFSDHLRFKREHLEIALTKAEMPREQITAISGIIDDVAYEVHDFVTWFVVLGGCFVFWNANYRTDRMVRRPKHIEPAPEAWQPKKHREKPQI